MPAAATVDNPAADRRRAPRRQPAQGTTCQLAASAGQQPRLGLVWNISLTGVSMLLGEPLEPGTQFQGELIAADGRTSLGLSMRVQHLCKLRTGDYFVGGHFQRQLTAQELRPFVGEGV